MTTKQEMQEQAKRLQEELDKLNEKINKIFDETSYSRWRATKNTYYFIDDEGHCLKDYDAAKEEDNFRYFIGNYFKTEQEAEEYRDNLITKQKLKDLALRLNKGVELNWADTSQFKYFIKLLRENKDFLDSDYIVTFVDLGQVYCLDKDFLNKAKQEIGEDKLIKLIKSGL